MDAQETRWVEEARQGSHEAFAQILRMHQAHVRGFLSRFVKSNDVVDDLAQETFLRGYRSLASFKGDSSLRTWLLGIARNMALRHLEELRSRRAHESVKLETELAGWLARNEEQSPLFESHHEKEVAALEQCLQSLAPHSSELISEFYYKRRQAAEIARATGKKEGAVWMALLRIREALRQCIQGRLQATESS